MLPPCIGPYNGNGSSAAFTEPTDIALSNSTILDTLAVGGIVGILSCTDAGVGDTHTYSINYDPDGKFQIGGVSGNELQLAATVDSSVDTSHLVVIEVRDQTGASYVELFTITVSEGNTAPTDISLTPASGYATAAPAIYTDCPVGTTVFTIAGVDPQSDPMTFLEIVDTDSKFTISGTSVILAAALDYEADSSHPLTIRATDVPGGLTYDEAFTITVLASLPAARMGTNNRSHNTWTVMTNSGKSVRNYFDNDFVNWRPSKPETLPSKFYFEGSASQLGGATGVRIGLADIVPTPTNGTPTILLGSTSKTVGVEICNGTGSFFVSGTIMATLGAFAANERICYAVDVTNELVWCRRGSGPWNNNVSADPAAGTGGISMATMDTAAIIPVVAASMAAGATASGYFAQSEWAHAAPSGFPPYPTGRPVFLGKHHTMHAVDNTLTLPFQYPKFPLSATATDGVMNEGDILLMLLSSDSVTGNSFSVPGTWTACGAAIACGTDHMSQMFWMRCTGGETGSFNVSQAVAGAAGNVFAATIYRWGNCRQTGTPFEGYSQFTPGVGQASWTSQSGTPSGPDRLGVHAMVVGNDIVSRVNTKTTGTGINTMNPDWQALATGSSAGVDESGVGNDVTHYWDINEWMVNGVACDTAVDSNIGTSYTWTNHFLMLKPRL